MSDVLLKDATSEELCEALVRHLETVGDDVLEKHFQRMVCRGTNADGGREHVVRTEATVWVMVGGDAGSFMRNAKRWLERHGYV